MDELRLELATIDDELSTYETAGFKHLQANLQKQLVDLRDSLEDNTKLSIEEVRHIQGQLQVVKWLLERPGELRKDQKRIREQLANGPETDTR